MSRSEVLASHRVLPGLLVFLVFSAAYLYSFPQSNVVYAIIVLLHATAGIGASLLLALHLLHFLRNGKFLSRLGWLLIAGGAVLGLVLVYTERESYLQTGRANVAGCPLARAERLLGLRSAWPFSWFWERQLDTCDTHAGRPEHEFRTH